MCFSEITFLNWKIKMAKKFIKEAIKHPGALRKELGAKTKKGPRGGTIKEPIPKAKIAKTVSRLSKKAEGEKKLSPAQLKLFRRAKLAQTLEKLPRRGRK